MKATQKLCFPTFLVVKQSCPRGWVIIFLKKIDRCKYYLIQILSAIYCILMWCKNFYFVTNHIYITLFLKILKDYESVFEKQINFGKSSLQFGHPIDEIAHSGMECMITLWQFHLKFVTNCTTVVKMLYELDEWSSFATYLVNF